VLLSVAAHAALSSATDAKVVFDATGPAGLGIEGTTSDLQAAESNGNLTLTVNLTRLTTGIGVRDKHTKETYLQVPTYPTTVLVVARSALAVPTGDQKAEATVPGTLTLHGQTHPVSVHYDAKRDASGIVVHGGFHVNMNDFGIQVPSYLGVTVKPGVEVHATFHVVGD